jgi:hypothetical protein
MVHIVKMKAESGCAPVLAVPALLQRPPSADDERTGCGFS